MTPIKNWTSRSMWYYSMSALYNMSPSAMMQGIRTVGAPAVEDFWAEVVKPFGSRALHNLDPSHLLGDAMCPNWGAKILDYGVCNHIAHVCAPFFEGIESWSQYENRRCQWEEEHRHTQMASGDHCSLSHGPNRRNPGVGMNEDPRWQNREVSLILNPGRRQGVREWQSHSTRKGTSQTLRGGSPMTCQAPGIKNCLHPLSPPRLKQWKNLRPSRWPSKRPWSLASPLPCPGRTRCTRRRNGQRCDSSTKGSPNSGSPPPLIGGW